MVRTGKLLKGIAVLAFAAAAWSGMGTSDVSAKIAISDVNVDTENQQMIVDTDGKSPEVLFGIAKKGTKKGTTTFKISQWDTHESMGVKEVKIDLSKLNNTKENFVAVKTIDMEQPYIIKIPAAAKVNVLTYNSESNELEFLAGAKKSEADPVGSFQYRTTGDWSTHIALDKDGKIKNVFKDYQYQGASLYVRVSAVTQSALVADNVITNAYDASDLDNKLDVYVSGTFPGKESKLNIAKQANGPSVSVQYTAGTLTLPKNIEYRILIKDGNGNYVFKEFSQESSGDSKSTDTGSSGNYIQKSDPENVTKNVKVNRLLSNSQGDAASPGAIGVLEVRTAAKENDYSPKKAKCASKWTRIDLEAASPLSDKELAPSVVASATSIIASGSTVGDSYGGAGIKYAVVKQDVDGRTIDAVKVTYGTPTYKDGKVTGTLMFTNVGNCEYQIIVSDKSSVAELKESASKLAASTGTTKTLSLKNVKDGSYVYIRKAGVQKTKTWAGVYVKLGIVDFPKSKKQMEDSLTSAATPATPAAVKA